MYMYYKSNLSADDDIAEFDIMAKGSNPNEESYVTIAKTDDGDKLSVYYICETNSNDENAVSSV